MKNILKKITFYSVLSVAVVNTTSCSDNFLNTRPLNEVPADALWKDINLAEAYMYNIYFTFQDTGFAEEMQSSATDETVFTHSGRGFKEINEGAFSPANIGWFDKDVCGHRWSKLYKNIRSCNDFIENITSAEALPADKRLQLEGEAYFLRAYFYHRLTRMFGGVPLVLKVTSTTDETFDVPRSSYDECITQILSDLEKAVGLLPPTVQKGRACKAAAQALIVRVLTDAASDLHDQPTAQAKSVVLQGATPEQVKVLFYTKGTRTERWNAVKVAAKAFLDDSSHGLQLSTYGSSTDPKEKATDVQNFFLTDNEETIFARYFIKTKPDESGTQVARFNGPAGYHCWSGNTPIQEMVDEYEMADGTPFDWSNPAHANAIYENREVRFYSSIFYDGVQWRERPDDYAKLEPYGELQFGSYQMKSGAIYSPGMETTNGRGESWNGTKTGYLIRKFINPAIAPATERSEVPWVFMRVTEIALCYIEACIELNELPEATNWLNKIRNRVLLPNTTATTQSELRKAYQHERKIEMFLEEQRFWDIRRWMIGEESKGLNQLHGISVQATIKPDATPQTFYKYDKNTYTYSYTVTDLSSSLETRRFKDKSYFLPIHRDEMNRNQTLIQNPGFE